MGYTIGFSENLTLWEYLLDNLKLRGLKHVDILVMDSACGVPELTLSIFPKSKVQVCTFHVMKNLDDKLKRSDRKTVLGLVSNLFKLSNRNIINLQLQEIIKEYPQNKKELENLHSRDYIYIYTEFPHRIHKLIRTTNRIERINGKIKTSISHKRVFQNRE